MKKLVKSCLLAFAFTFAFVFLGAVTVSAEALNNTKISEYNATYSVEGSTYYAVNGSAEEKTIKLNNISNGKSVSKWYTLGVPMFKNYTALVSVVKCADYDAAGGMCKTWGVYSYSNDEVATMDSLKNGLTLKFKAENLKESKGTTIVNGAKLSELSSAYGVDKTYFVVVQYELQGGSTYDPDIFKVVFTDDLAKININAANSNGTSKVTITSGTPIALVKYFNASEAIEGEYDFAEKYEAAAEKLEVLSKAEANPNMANGVFTYEVEITLAEGKHYYLQAADSAGNVARIYINDNQQDNDNEGDTNALPPGGGENVGNTNVGKIILISLLVVLVLSVVLVIVQRIVDYRKKLY